MKFLRSISRHRRGFDLCIHSRRANESVGNSFHSICCFLSLAPGAVESAQALEYDSYAFNAPYEFLFSSEFVTGGFWQIWDQLHIQWVNTPLRCALKDGWHHIEWYVHRVPGDTSCAGYPCEHYDLLGVDYVYTLFNLTEPAGPLPAEWANAHGVQLQLDLNKDGGELHEYFRRINLMDIP